MAKDINQLHPLAQAKLLQLIEDCKKAGIAIKIIECVRTTIEQDALYAKGRTTKGSIVTNAKGSSYSSMHQWGIAFDVGINMDANNDGDIDINDIYNVKLLNKVGQIGKKLGLEWGGDWTSIVDKPHFQLPYWGSTATLLRNQYGTPEAFKKTWPKNTITTTIKTNTTKTTTTSKTITATVIASSGLTLRKAKGNKVYGTKIIAIPKGARAIVLKKNAETQKINGVKYNMSKIKYNNTIGYVATKYLKF